MSDPSTRAGVSRRVVALGLFVGSCLAGAAAGASRLWRDGEPSTTEESAVDPAESVAPVHEAGVTGNGVRVGVMDATGFDRDHPMLAGRVAEARSFGGGGPLAVDRRDDHGTAAATTVARTAPDADLYLASVGDDAEFTAGVAWLVAEGVDVVVAPVTFHGESDDGSAAVDRAVADAVEAGVVVVAPAGNHGDGHWVGQFVPLGVTDEATHPEFADAQAFGGDARNPISGGDGRLDVWVSWDPAGVEGEFVAELYRDTDDGLDLVASSTPATNGAARLATTVDGAADERFLVVRGPVDAVGTRLRVSSPTHGLRVGNRAGSLAPPATAPGAVTVGAVDDRTGLLEEYSAAGPTADGRTGVDLVAPGRVLADGRVFEGTSAAAAYAAGVAALLLDTDPGLEPDGVVATLGETADPIDHAVPTAVGDGLIDPVSAVDGGGSNGSTEGET